MTNKQMLVAICVSIFSAPSVYAQYPQGGCLTEVEPPNTAPGYRMTPFVGKTYCAPPNGTIFEDAKGTIVCGRGQCVTDANDQDSCSQVPGGSALIDKDGRAKCVGGCIKPHRNYCQVPR